MTRITAILLGALVLGCGGCTRFANPAVADSGASLDSRLPGHWLMKTKEGIIDVEIRRDGEEGLLIARPVGPPEEKAEQASIVTARLGQLDFMSLRFTERSKGYWSVFRYELTGDQLIVTPGDDRYWKKAVDEGQLEGTVEKDALSAAVTVNASAKQLRDVLLGDGTVIFPADPTPEIVLERVK